jgi:predicted amidohydrolase YtcJ
MRRALPLLALLIAACEPGANAADLAIFGTIWTGDSAAPEVRAMAVRGETIAAVGDSATIAKLVGPNTRILNVGNGLIVPGFADDHVHLTDGGAQLGYVDLRDAATPAEFTRRIKAFVATLKPGEWVLGGGWDHEMWHGAPLPKKEWIDSVTGSTPVFIQRLDGHMGLANSVALGLAKLTRDTPDITGGTIVKDANGNPTGVLKDEAMNPVFAVIPSATAEQLDTSLARAMRHANSRGLTSVAAVSAPWNEVAAVKRAKANGSLSLRVALFPALGGWRSVADTVRANGVGDDWVRLAGVKGFVDGSLGSTTALFFQPYLDDSTSSGLLTTPLDSLARWIGSADSAGLQVVVHAIGDRANALLLDIFDSVATAHGARDRRFRIEHAQHLRVEDITRIAKSGVIPSMQPYHAADDGRWAWKRIRPAQLAGTYAFKSLLEAKARLNFGSDWPVAPLDPLLGIWAAVTRQTLDGNNPQGWYPEQKISVEDALRAYTASNAFGVFAESQRGTLAAGKLADFVMIDRDIRKVPPDSIRTAKVRTTVVGGKIVF